MEPLFSMDSEGVHIASEEVTKKLAKKNLSPSLVTGLEGCAARWVVETFARDELQGEELDTAATRGSLFHKVMEEVFAEEPENRTTDLVKKKVEEVLLMDDFAHFKTNREAIQWLRDAINGYYKMGGDPTKVTISKLTTKNGKEVKGLEHFVRGKIGNTKRSVLGFVDRIIDNPKDPDKKVVEDWKSGGKAKKWNKKLTSTEGWPEQRQQTVYSMLLQEQGINVTSARLIYPVAQEIVNVDPNNEDVRARVTKDLEEADAKLSHYEETNTFEYSPSFLCAWCPLARGACPSAMIKPYKKMQDALATQPSVDVLSEFIEFN